MEVNETKKVVLALNYSEGHFNQFSLLSDEGWEWDVKHEMKLMEI